MLLISFQLSGKNNATEAAPRTPPQREILGSRPYACTTLSMVKSIKLSHPAACRIAHAHTNTQENIIKALAWKGPSQFQEINELQHELSISEL